MNKGIRDYILLVIIAMLVVVGCKIYESYFVKNILKPLMIYMTILSFGGSAIALIGWKKGWLFKKKSGDVE